MNRYLELSEEQQRLVLTQTAARVGLPEIISAILDDELWNSIHHHRSVFTPLKEVDYTPDIRERICLVPPENCIDDWKKDYQAMCESMIYEPEPLPFNHLIERMRKLESIFHNKKV